MGNVCTGNVKVIPMGVIIKNFTVQEQLGYGWFGEVYKATKNKGGIYAVKVIPVETIDTLWKKDLKTAKRISQHKNLVRIHETISRTKQGNFCIVMELCDGGNLDRYAIQQTITAEEGLSFMIDMAEGLEYLHSVKVIHRNLKPRNVLLVTGFQRFVCKLSDFGTARIQQTDRSSSRVRDTWYDAPELTDTMSYSFPADIYSLALLYHAITDIYTEEDEGNQRSLIPATTYDGELIAVTALVTRSDLGKTAFINSHYSSNEKLGDLVFKMLNLIPIVRPDIQSVVRSLNQIANTPCTVGEEEQKEEEEEEEKDECNVNLTQAIGQLLFMKALSLAANVPDIPDEDSGSFTTDAVNGEIKVELGSKDSGIDSSQVITPRTITYEF